MENEMTCYDCFYEDLPLSEEPCESCTDFNNWKDVSYTEELKPQGKIMDKDKKIQELEDENKILTCKLGREYNRNLSFEDVRQRLYREIKDKNKEIAQLRQALKKIAEREKSLHTNDFDMSQNQTYMIAIEARWRAERRERK